jgi:hypothetical protein
MQRWWTHRMQAAATPGTIRALMAMNALVDVRDLLPTVRVPTLVVHRRGDALFGIEEARYLADHIPDATLCLLDGADHFVAGDPGQILDAIEPFVLSVPKPVHQLALAAVAFAGGHDSSVVTHDLIEAGGRRRHTAAGDVVVLFDGPATAVRAGLAALAPDRDARIGLAIAEVAVDGGPVSGPGVEHAVRLGRQAPRGDLLVAPTAGTLLTPSEIELEALGAVQDEERPLRARRA